MWWFDTFTWHFSYHKDCPNTELVGNGVCNDESNNADCNFDGGDCTTTTSTTTMSTLSTTHDPGIMHQL